jgi:hypothetical protein
MRAAPRGNLARRPKLATASRATFRTAGPAALWI